ncbi:DUF6907 domain-containing protein [Pseudonocardia zijingensis]|uniref:Uncharacterized protein n=1 Tax=Pseudonocardia zijingensis TaxID=153376 RepID=A0ABP3YLJ4_9PSEU
MPERSLNPPPPAHPSWCSLAHCEQVAVGDIRHSSVPTLLTTSEDDVEVAVAVVRDDELGRAGYRAAATGVSVTLRHLAGAWARGHDSADVMLTASEARRLAGDLVAFAAMAEHTAVARPADPPPPKNEAV